MYVSVHGKVSRMVPNQTSKKNSPDNDSTWQYSRIPEILEVSENHPPDE